MARLSGEETNSNFIDHVLIRQVIELTIYRNQGEHANHYTTDAARNENIVEDNLFKQNL